MVCGPGVPPYDFLNLYGVFNSKFFTRNGCETARPKQPIGADENGETADTRAPRPSSAPIGSLGRAVLQEKLVQNNGTEGAPRGDGPTLKENCIYKS